MLQNAYSFAKIGADTAENERNYAENLPKIGNYPTEALETQVLEMDLGDNPRFPILLMLYLQPREPAAPPGCLLSSPRLSRGRGRRHQRPVGLLPIFGKISAKCCSFSAVSAPIFARKYAFCSIFQNLPDYQAEILEIWQYLQILRHLQNFCWIFTKIADFSNRFFAKILRLQRCKRMQIL